MSSYTVEGDFFGAVTAAGLIDFRTTVSNYASNTFLADQVAAWLGNTAKNLSTPEEILYENIRRRAAVEAFDKGGYTFAEIKRVATDKQIVAMSAAKKAHDVEKKTTGSEAAAQTAALDAVRKVVTQPQVTIDPKPGRTADPIIPNPSIAPPVVVTPPVGGTPQPETKKSMVPMIAVVGFVAAAVGFVLLKRK